MKNTNIPEIQFKTSSNSVEYTAANNWEAEFIGSNFPQIVDDDLKIHTPLNDTEVILSFKCKKGGEVVEKDFTLQIKGVYGKAEKKPNIIPEPAQWHATGGIFKNDISYTSCEELSEVSSAFAEEYELASGKKAERKENGNIVFSINPELEYLGKEGYEIECTEDCVKVNSFTEIGAIWAGKTIIQLMLQGGFPCGVIRDYPKYSIRGFMLDVGRRPVSMDTLKKIVNSMAWYKMNDFQVHLGDNYIWLEHYAENGDESTFDAYQAFRLESSLKNDKGETATSKDYSYSKKEFREFIEWAKAKGVSITPEIDMPAHALAFTKVFPEYAVFNEVSPLMQKRPLTDHINIADPKAVDFVKQIFDDYTMGENPVFPSETAVHIGADEFLSDYGAYRRFINEFIPYIKKTNSVRLWGSLSWIKDNPETPIAEEAIKDVQLNLWSSDWADGREMYNMGYKLINTIDFLTYIVPNGTKIRAPYMDFVNKRKAFKKFEPNSVRLKNKSYTNLPAGNKQVLGGCYAIWQDNIDKKSKGINEQDLYDRFADCAAVFAEKNWGSCTDKHSAKEVDRAALTIKSLTKKEKSEFRPIRDVNLTGGECFIESGCRKLETGTKLKLSIEFKEIVPNQIIMEADAPYGTYDIRITENGRLGFTAEGFTYEFNYTPVPNRRLNLTIDTKPLRTKLKAGLFCKKAIGSFTFNGTVRNNSIKNSSFSIPVQRIGSKTNAVKAHIYSIEIK
ncbi:MAG: family 20 glycosylhydrolase [Eubacterium sp.]|nr:family 20 glycosylhydrolase [Eubacterium sp.]